VHHHYHTELNCLLKRYINYGDGEGNDEDDDISIVSFLIVIRFQDSRALKAKKKELERMKQEKGCSLLPNSFEGSL